MGLASNLREAVGKFLEGAGQSLRLNVTTSVQNTRTQSPNNKDSKKLAIKTNKKTVVKAKEGDIDSSNTNRGIQIDTVHIGAINLTVNPTSDGNFSIEDIPDGLKLLSQAFGNKEISFVTETEQNTLDDALAFEKNPEITRLMHYFKPRLTPRSFTLMRTGFYIRHLNQTNPVKVAAEWQKILANTDRVERRVINLASAGYFENYFEPLAKKYEAEGYSIEDFEVEFETIIDSPHFVVFVSGEMTPGTVTREVLIKARKNMKFRVRDDVIYIHAMGGSNVSTVESAVEDLRRAFKRVELAPADDKIQGSAVRYKVYYREPIQPDFYS